MCRIAGIANKSLSLPSLEAMVTQMCNLQQHGGPDDAGVYSCPESNLVLGHRRLALLDLSPAGHQPMVYGDRYIISFNGEIYNFPELKKELMQAGMIFHTQCDTEVILAAFARWNTQGFARLKGMFAFALYDTIEKDLYLVRDPSGIKPLYYSVSDTSIEFASEMRAFAASGNKSENQHWPVFQLAYGHVPEPVTTLLGVKPLHKGCFYKYNLSTGVSSYQSFTHYSYSNSITDVSAARLAIKNALHNAVGRHLLSDAPIGVFLSGGIDSGIITTLASGFQHRHLKTLSLYFKEEQFSEKKYQDSIIDQIHCKHYQHLLTETEFNACFPAILQDMDMPSCDGINTWFISKYAKQQGLKAVLSGIGGDELFGGYPSFNRISIAGRLQRIPSRVLLQAKQNADKRMNRLTYLSLEGIKGKYLFLRGQYIPRQIARQLGATEKQVWSILEEHPALPSLSRLLPKNQASWMELNMYMQNQLLRDADVMSMAHGVEIRVPFLDEEVIKTALSVTPAVKYSGRIPKQLLIDAFKNKLPEVVWNRQKMGFSLPFTQWLHKSAFVKDTMESGNAAARNNYKDFKEGKLHWIHLMSLIILQTRGVS
ncbi:asparagine synthase (glutamine-hydrolyzing) [Ginsengibacter hankyongi]|uniref:asparagine synthase (glutamine-hydrolyzing) n=1 Tax=Ginsengibacter hankyongi TaxID=2607284 RepID=UPI0019253B3B|nr:asparagine synthase (glutamine-hydrolyzing) [Ginsengibacter hankyongi]